MEKPLHGLRRPAWLSRFGRAASVSVSPPAPMNPRDALPSPTDEDIRRILREDKAKSLPRPLPPSAAFLCVSRQQAQEVARYKTISPDVGKYDPNYHAGKSRTDHSPSYKSNVTSPRAKRIFLPPCLGHIDKSYPRHDRNLTEEINASFDVMNKRTVSDLKQYSMTIEGKTNGDSPGKPKAKLKGLVSLTHQLDRPDFVKDDGPPSPHRFTFTRNDSLVLSTTRRLAVISFGKGTKRPELFRPSPLPDYRPNTRLTRRTSPKPLSFAAQPGRKAMVLDHLLRNPPQGDQKRIDKGWGQLQTSPARIPNLKSLSPRDDLMYRTNEQYKLNVPRRQLAMDVPIYQGEFKEAFRGTKAAIQIYL